MTEYQKKLPEYAKNSHPALLEERALMKKRPVSGTRFTIPRPGKAGVEVILNQPEGAEGPLPALFNLHGGGWLGGDAVLMDSFCQKMARELPALVVNVNYTKMDEQPFFYAVEELADAVCYLRDHAGEYGVDPHRMAVGGESAGAHLAAACCFLLGERGIRLAGQMLVYPCLDFPEGDPVKARYRSLLVPSGETPHPLLSPLSLPDSRLQKDCPAAVIILCGKDELRPDGAAYAKRLIDTAVPVAVKEYPEAFHGFLEVNQPEYDPRDDRRTPEQEAFCQDCESFLVRSLRAILAE